MAEVNRSHKDLYYSAINSYDKAFLDKIKELYSNTIYSNTAITYNVVYNLIDKPNKVLRFPLINIYRPRGYDLQFQNMSAGYQGADLGNINNDNNLQSRFLVANLMYQLDIYAKSPEELNSITLDIIQALKFRPILSVPQYYLKENVIHTEDYEITYLSGPIEQSEFDNNDRIYRNYIQYEIKFARLFNYKIAPKIKSVEVNILDDWIKDNLPTPFNLDFNKDTQVLTWEYPNNKGLNGITFEIYKYESWGQQVDPINIGTTTDNLSFLVPFDSINSDGSYLLVRAVDNTNEFNPSKFSDTIYVYFEYAGITDEYDNMYLGMGLGSTWAFDRVGKDISLEQNSQGIIIPYYEPVNINGKDYDLYKRKDINGSLDVIDEITEETDSEGNVFVRIPKFYVKQDRKEITNVDGTKSYIVNGRTISKNKLSNSFIVHPAFLKYDNINEVETEVDYVYIAKYLVPAFHNRISKPNISYEKTTMQDIAMPITDYEFFGLIDYSLIETLITLIIDSGYNYKHLITMSNIEERFKTVEHTSKLEEYLDNDSSYKYAWIKDTPYKTLFGINNVYGTEELAFRDTIIYKNKLYILRDKNEPLYPLLDNETPEEHIQLVLNRSYKLLINDIRMPFKNIGQPETDSLVRPVRGLGNDLNRRDSLSLITYPIEVTKDIKYSRYPFENGVFPDSYSNQPRLLSLYLESFYSTKSGLNGVAETRLVYRGNRLP